MWPATAWARARSRNALPRTRRSPKWRGAAWPVGSKGNRPWPFVGGGAGVVGGGDAVKGEKAMAFAVAGDSAALDSDAARLKLEGEVMKQVDSQLGAVARPSRVHF